ncbi:MAG: hypothetical protein U5L01_04550 [Rheinheimera sp.]|nr:hypothetical protein [Rheinheimera sp.]
MVKYPLGTDDLGRDLISRLMRGSSYTFGLAIFAVLGALAGGLLLGALSGMSKGFKSSIFNHLLDLALTIPSLLLAIVDCCSAGSWAYQYYLGNYTGTATAVCARRAQRHPRSS